MNESCLWDSYIFIGRQTHAKHVLGPQEIKNKHKTPANLIYFTESGV